MMSSRGVGLGFQAESLQEDGERRVTCGFGSARFPGYHELAASAVSSTPLSSVTVVGWVIGGEGLSRRVGGGSVSLTRIQRQSGCAGGLDGTAMPNPSFPQEILDSIVDHLHENRDALEGCCLVSKSWIPRTRKHLFAEIVFDIEQNLISWKKIFPDPSISPAHYAETLYVGCLHAVTPADAEASGWITGFSRVVNLKLDAYRADIENAERFLVPFHRISPTIKSLYVYLADIPPSRILNLILSFPLLEDLTLDGDDPSISNVDGPDGLSTSIQPSNQPALTGSLELHLGENIRPIAHRLLSLPGGIRPRNLTLTACGEEDHLLAVALLEECLYVLESLNIRHDFFCMSIWSLHPH